MRISRHCSPKFGLAILIFALIACFWAVSGKPLETRAVAAATEAKAGNDRELKSADSPSKSNQVISFTPPSAKAFGDQPFEANVIASSGLPVSLSANGHCTVAESTVHLTGVGSCTITANQEGNDDYHAAASVARSFFISNAGDTVLDVTSFGANGEDNADDAPAFQQALDALAAAGGGTLFVPPGRFMLVTPVAKSFTGLASSISIRGAESNGLVNNDDEGEGLATGLGLTSEIYPQTNEQATALRISGLETFLVTDIAFVGTPDVETDALITLLLSEVEDATINHCEFYGLRTHIENAGIIFAHRTGLRIEQSKFLGTFGDSSANTPVVQNIEWKNISLSNVAFVDYGLRPEIFCKCEGASYAWVTVGNAAATSADSPRREASFQDVFMDEGGLVGLFSLPSYFQPPSAPIDLIYISNFRMNVSNLGTSGNYLSDVERALIENGKYEWSQNAAAAIQFIGAGHAIIDQTECVDAANRIAADDTTQKLTVINSVYTHLDSQAQTTKTLVVSPEQDPVQYVRLQFEQTLNRAPDPAAHFYWSDLLLQCDENPQCLSDKHNALAQYLSTAPSAKFSISGEIKDEQDSPLSGVVVTLSGSQSVSAQTDDEGRYYFSGLPTSGVYTLTPSLAEYAFQNPVRTIITPAGDQTIDFNALHNGHQISGRVANGQGHGLSSVVVTLAGSKSASTTTDLNGNYGFAVEAGGNYTVTPAKTNYTFSPALTTINEIDENQTANFTGTLVNHVLSGQVSGNGAGLAGVTVTLSGSQTGAMTTVADGTFSFSVPAEGNYTITPALAHHTFNPQQKSYSNLTADKSTTFVATLNTHKISGIITSTSGDVMPNVTVTLSGGQSTTVTTDAAGKYQFENIAAGLNYVVSPVQNHFTFSPQTQSFSNLSGDVSGNFSASQNKHVISGRVLNASGSGMQDVTITLTGSQSATATTDANGAYSFSDIPAGGDYTVAASKDPYVFSPPAATLNDLSQDRIANFTGSLVNYVLSGRVTNNGQPLGGVTMALSGLQADSVTTDADGNFSFIVSAEGNYTITPVLKHFTFTPQELSYSNVSADSSGDFVAVQNTHTISGQVTNANAGIPGVTIALSGSQSASMITDENGAYSFPNLPAGGNYTITPSLISWVFNPANHIFNDLGANQTAAFIMEPNTTIEFSNASYSVSESTPSLVVTINRVGNTSGVSTVDFATTDDAGLQDCNVINGKASPRCDFNFTLSTVQFAVGQTSKLVSIPIIDGVYVEGNETFNIRLSNPTGAKLGAVNSATVTITDNDTGSDSNPVSNTDFFIRQHYLDFLGREPDPAGLEGWRNILNNCGITILQPCDRIEVSSAFFRSQEFQGRGYFVYRFYASMGKVPLYDQFMVDLAKLSGFLTPEELEAEKVVLTNEFMDRPDFHSKYDALTSPVAYVDGLLQTVNLASHPSRQSWIDGLTSGSLTRAEVLRALVDSTEMYQKYYNEAFVVMQYFGYLRRTADASYLQWIQTMNSNGGDYRVMVSGFLNSVEYRQRFGP